MESDWSVYTPEQLQERVREVLKARDEEWWAACLRVIDKCVEPAKYREAIELLRTMYPEP